MHEVKDLEEFKKILAESGDKLILVDFMATWCGPCKMIAPHIKTFEKSYPNVVFCKVDVDEADDVAAEYNISAMPTFLYFKNGQKISEIVGANEEEVGNKIASLL